MQRSRDWRGVYHRLIVSSVADFEIAGALAEGALTTERCAKHNKSRDCITLWQVYRQCVVASCAQRTSCRLGIQLHLKVSNCDSLGADVVNKHSDLR